MTITHLFFDIGGVLGTNGWDREQRRHAAERFGLDAEFEARHDELVGEWEIGRITLAEYLESTVFYTTRPFSPKEFSAFMLAESKPYPETIALAQRVAVKGSARLFTLNNESAELNEHRIALFGLGRIFSGFLSSCWLGIRKPSRLIFERARGIVQARAEEILFIDDRSQNTGPARSLGFLTHHYVGAQQLEKTLATLNLI
jgi:putative hydrolase of the HAD superfamily